MSWTNENNALHKTYIFADFEAAMHFMQQAAIEIAIHNHHPEWSNVYNKVSVKLTTHDAGNSVTEKDEKLAVALDTIYNSIS